MCRESITYGKSMTNLLYSKNSVNINSLSRLESQPSGAKHMHNMHERENVLLSK